MGSMQKVSRHRLAEYVAKQAASGSLNHELIRTIAAYLVENKRTNQADLLMSDTAAVMARDYGVVLAEVISARPLEASVRSAIAEYVKKAENAGKAELDESVDEGLIGGVIIRTPTAEFDSSIRSQLRRLRSIKENKE